MAPVPGQPYALDVPIFDSNGKLATGVTFSASEISRDGASFVAMKTPPVEIPNASGVYTVSLDASEMTFTKRLSGRLISTGALLQDSFFELLLDTGAGVGGGVVPGASSSSYSFPSPSERATGPIAAVYESSVNQDIAAGATLLVSLDTLIYDAPYFTPDPSLSGVVVENPSAPYVNITSPWVFQVPFYAGYGLELQGVVGGDGGPVDIYVMVNFVAYIWEFGVTGPFALHKYMVLNYNDLVEFFIAAPGATGATLIDLRGTIMRVEQGTGLGIPTT